MLQKVCVLAALAAALFCGRADAVTITAWNLLGFVGSEASAAPSGAPANVTGNSLVRGPGLAGATGANSMNASGWNDLGAGDYFEFGFTVTAGYQVDLSNFYVGTRSSSTGPGTLGLYTSLDGYVAPVATFSQAPGSNYVNSNVDLSALPNVTGAFTARIKQVGSGTAGGGAASSSGTARVTAYFVGGAFDRDMQFTGTVSAIPEPSSFVLLGLGMIGTALLVRQRRKSVR